MTLLELKNVGWVGNVGGVAGADVAFASLYEAFNPLTTVAKQHFIEWFSGSVLDSIWNQRNTNGVGTYAMVDAVDEGFSITTGTSTSNASDIDMNDIRHYSEDNYVCISIFRRVTTLSIVQQISVNNGATFNHYVLVQDDTINTFYDLFTKDGTTPSAQDSDIAIDATFHSHKIELNGTNARLDIDGVLKVTKTTNLPVAALQPAFRVFARGTGGKEGRFRYIEAYST